MDTRRDNVKRTNAKKGTPHCRMWPAGLLPFAFRVFVTTHWQATRHSNREKYWNRRRNCLQFVPANWLSWWLFALNRCQYLIKGNLSHRSQQSQHRFRCFGHSQIIDFYIFCPFSVRLALLVAVLLLPLPRSIVWRLFFVFWLTDSLYCVADWLARTAPYRSDGWTGPGDVQCSCLFEIVDKSQCWRVYQRFKWKTTQTTQTPHTRYCLSIRRLIIGAFL